MGVESYLIAAAVNGIAAQRLVRKLCPDCRQSYVPSEELRRSIRLPDSVAPGIRLFRPVGCPRCNHTGYSGRVAIIEFLTMSDRLRDLIVRNAPVGELREASQSEGLETMYQYGLRKCITGLTSVEEVMKATGDF
jgi:general secretion pathway protein E